MSLQDDIMSEFDIPLLVKPVFSKEMGELIDLIDCGEIWDAELDCEVRNYPSSGLAYIDVNLPSGAMVRLTMRVSSTGTPNVILHARSTPSPNLRTDGRDVFDTIIFHSQSFFRPMMHGSRTDGLYLRISAKVTPMSDRSTYHHIHRVHHALVNNPSIVAACELAIAFESL